MPDEWLVEVRIDNEDCPFKEWLVTKKRKGCSEMDYNSCTYDNCPHKLPATEEEYNAKQ